MGRQITVELTIKRKLTPEERVNGHANDRYLKETHAYTVDSDDVPLIMIESMEENDFGAMRAAIADFLELPEEHAKQLTIGNLKQIGQAMKDAQNIPNG